jgi:lipoic acid synthetase
MILGDTCTRSCGFCAVHSGRPGALDWAEPVHVANAAAAMGLRHVVVTSVNRDDQPDGGAEVFARTIRALRHRIPGVHVEVLTPDFMGVWSAVEAVVDAAPDIYNHNTETVPRLYGRVRPKARYARSIELLRRVKERAPSMLTKSGIMLGLGETREEVLGVMEDLRAAGVDIMTIGQYLRPDARHLPVERWVHPDEFADLRREGLACGFGHVESGPLVRSSYHAAQQVPDAPAGVTPPSQPRVFELRSA